MKKLLIFAMLLCTKNLFAQKDTVGLHIPFIDSTIAYERVFNVSNAPKNLLYANAGIWLAETHPYYVNTQLTLSDPQLSRVVGRVSAFSDNIKLDKVLWQSFYGQLNYSFTIQIDCKDNKYRVRIYNIQYVSGTVYNPMDNLMLSLIASKSYAITDNVSLNTKGLKLCFQVLNTVVDNVMNMINKDIIIDNSF
jgi:hypothetical protein